MKLFNKKALTVMLVAGAMMCMTACGGKKDTTTAATQTDADTEATTIEATSETSETTETTEESLNIIPEEYAYAMTVSINPLVKLYFDKSDKVNGVEYLNEDAEVAYSELDLIGTDINDGMKLLVDTAIEKEYLKENGEISVELAEVVDTTVVKDDSSLQAAKEAITECLAEEKNADLNATIQLEVAKDVTSQTGIELPKICEACNGTGNDCQECGGTAIVNCKRCNNGYETCGVCDGYGHETCHGCNGAGGDCNHCGGAGWITCSQCGGAGGFNCSWCGGALKHICPMCWGEQVCATCGGTGYAK